jgi:hypothetical protein
MGASGVPIVLPVHQAMAGAFRSVQTKGRSDLETKGVVMPLGL